MSLTEGLLQRQCVQWRRRTSTTLPSRTRLRTSEQVCVTALHSAYRQGSSEILQQ